MKTRHLLALIAAAIAGLVIFLFVNPSGDSRKTAGMSIGTPTAAAACQQGEKDCLPPLTYIDMEGNAYPPAKLKGHVVLVNFWATWCHPCQNEIPALSRIYDQYKNQGVLVLGVMTDSPDAQAFLNFASDHEMTYPVVRANPDLMLAYDYPDAIPATWVSDRSGPQVWTTTVAIR